MHSRVAAGCSAHSLVAFHHIAPCASCSCLAPHSPTRCIHLPACQTTIPRPRPMTPIQIRMLFPLIEHDGFNRYMPESAHHIGILIRTRGPARQVSGVKPGKLPSLGSANCHFGTQAMDLPNVESLRYLQLPLVQLRLGVLDVLDACGDRINGCSYKSRGPYRALLILMLMQARFSSFRLLR
jgi:hypothetical protein